jgi:catechol 2,3-dioxygenase-like lactoylglutathione lyase family enzyme
VSDAPVRLVALRVDAEDPLGLARFWADALRWDVADTGGEEVALVPTDGTPFPVVFVASATRKAEKNRIHLDLTTTSAGDQDETVAMLLERGGRHVDIGQGADEPHVVLADPEGNELCVIEPGNSFLAGCGRLGSITCDGTAAVGYFWRDALGWPLVWDQDGETAIRAPGPTGPFITWGPPVPPKLAPNRLRLDVAPAGAHGDQRAAIDRLVALGAQRVGTEAGGVLMTDPDGNELRVSPAR